MVEPIQLDESDQNAYDSFGKRDAFFSNDPASRGFDEAFANEDSYEARDTMHTVAGGEGGNREQAFGGSGSVYGSRGDAFMDSGDVFGNGRGAFDGHDEIFDELSDDVFDNRDAQGAFENHAAAPSGRKAKDLGSGEVYEPAFADSYEQSSYDDFFADDFVSDRHDEDDEDDDGFNDTLNFGEDFWREESTDQIRRIEPRRAVENKDFRARSRTAPDKRRIAIIAGAALAVVAAVILVICFAMGIIGGKAIPNVQGMTEADARSVLEDEGFSVKTMQVKSDETEGLVLITDPGAGSFAHEGTEVIIHIATARFIPEIVGKTSDEAKALIAEAGYENVKYEPEYTDGEENLVTSVSPEAGTRAKSSMEVIVKVSENYKVPDIANKGLDDAKKAITDAGLVAEVEYIDSDQYPDGSVIGTTPEAGKKVSAGETVFITVTRTRGVELAALTEELLAAGSTVTIDGVSWEIESVMSISYQGNDTVAFTATGKPMVSVRGQTLVGSSETIDGQVVWSADNEVVSIG